MARFFLVLASTLLLDGSVCWADDPPSTDIFGEWVVMEMIFKGVVQGVQPDHDYIKFDKDGMSLSSGGGERRFGFPYKCTSRPGAAELDITLPDKTDLKAKYELKGDILRIIWHQGGGDRPTHFDAVADKQLTLRVLKRVK